MLDQFSGGLDVLGLMEVAHNFSQLCKKLFVLTSENLVTVTSVKEATLIFEARDDTEKKLKAMFEKFLLENSFEGLYCNITLCYKYHLVMTYVGFDQVID